MSHYALLLCLGCMGATFLAAQVSTDEVDVSHEPHHHLTFENEYVRVFNVHVDPNAETQMHWHHHDYIAITLGDAEVSNTVKDKPPVTAKLPDGDTRFSSGNFAHHVRDIGTQPFRNVTIEILQDEWLRNSAAAGKIHWDEDRGMEVLDRGTQQILFVKDGIRVTEFEIQPGGVVPMRQYTGPRLLVAVSDLEITDLELRGGVKSDAAGGPMPGHIRSGDSKWLPGGYTHTITNTGSKPAKFVTLEFP